MLDRINAIPSHEVARGALRGAVLDSEDDPILQELVAEAAAALSMPIGLISLVLDHTQFFRAHTGLPPDLRLAQATDRDVSFCQFVVRDGKPMVVSAASERSDLPQLLVREYGVESYLGVPVRIGSAVVGTLCVLDVERREFDQKAMDQLREISLRASYRLSELSDVAEAEAEPADPSHHPAFGELHKKLERMSLGLASLRLAHAEIGPVVRLLDSSHHEGLNTARALGVLAQSAAAYGSLGENLESLEAEFDRLVGSMRSIEDVLTSTGRPMPIFDAIKIAVRATGGGTSRIGGVRLAGVPMDAKIAAPAHRTIAALGAALRILGEHGADAGCTDGIVVEGVVEGELVRLRVTVPGIQPDVAATAYTALRSELPRGVGLGQMDTGVELRSAAG